MCDMQCYVARDAYKASSDVTYSGSPKKKHRVI